MMNRISIIAHLIAFSLLSVIFVNVAYAREISPSSTVQLRKVASGLATESSASSAAAQAPTTSTTTTASSKPVMSKIKYLEHP
jgi:hypothetical protein